MYHRSLKPGCAPQNGTPFICRLIPFVGAENPVIHPLICQKLPFVWNKGFTLVELIVALTIAGILMAVAAPALQKFVSSNRLTGQVNELLADINLARSEAIKRSTTTGVCVTAAGGTSCVAAGNWANGWLVYYFDAVTSANVTVKSHESLTGKNTLASPADQIVFSRSGLLSIAIGTGQFTLTDPTTNDRRIVCIATSGRPSLSGVNCT